MATMKRVKFNTNQLGAVYTVCFFERNPMPVFYCLVNRIPKFDSTESKELLSNCFRYTWKKIS